MERSEPGARTGEEGDGDCGNGGADVLCIAENPKPAPESPDRAKAVFANSMPTEVGFLSTATRAEPAGGTY